MSINVDLLSSTQYFSGLDLAKVESVRPFVLERTATKGEYIIDDGETAEALYLVISGALKEIKTSAEGKELILRIVRPGESFNDIPVFDGGHNIASVQAIGSVSLYEISSTNMEIILHEHPDVALNAIKVIAQRARFFTSLVEDLSFKHVIGRIAKLLLEYADNRTESGIKLTQQDMAAIVGTVREMVSRSLKALEEKGIIKMNHHRIVIIDAEALREAVE